MRVEISKRKENGMKTEILKNGENAFTKTGILEKAAEFKGLKLKGRRDVIYTEPIAEYVLNDDLFAALEKEGIKKQERPDCGHKILTLIDENPQEQVPGWSPSNYWSFNTREDGGGFDLRMTLCASLALSVEERNVRFLAKVHSPFLSACDRLPNFRVFRVLVEKDIKNVPQIAKALAFCKNGFDVSWRDIGMRGMRRLSSLFDQFAGRNQAIRELGQRNVFDPAPHPHYTEGDVFIAEPAHAAIMDSWAIQLENYRASLSQKI